jgi:glycerol-3-phosphate acyltransferase PlsY
VNGALPLVVAVALGYLLGAIPSGLLIGRWLRGVDIRQSGSGRTGATNAMRSLGARGFALTFVADAGKAAIAVLIARAIGGDGSLVAESLAAIAAIVGHNWSLFLKGSGGKGVATSAGVFLALMPIHALIALVVFLVFFRTTRHVSVGSMAAAVALFIATFFIHTPAILRALVLVASVMVLIKHIPNMKRLARGEEPKVNFGGR